MNAIFCCCVKQATQDASASPSGRVVSPESAPVQLIDPPISLQPPPSVTANNHLQTSDAKSKPISTSENNKHGQNDADNKKPAQLNNSRDSDDDDDIEIEEPVQAIKPQKTANRGRRTSVSAESMVPSAAIDFVPIVIPKSDHQRERIKESIKTNFLFTSCDEDQYKSVVDAMAEKKVLEGEDVIKQGGVGDFFYIVESGSLDVFVSKDSNAPIKVYQYGPGGSFGELALMYNAPRAATVTATSDCVLWALDRVSFRQILLDKTSRKRRMYEGFLEEVKILSSLEPYERHKIADALESRTFEDGEVVIREGDTGDEFYIIEKGEANVTKTVNGVEEKFPSLKKGAYFGELALLSDKPRQATITASGKLVVAKLGKPAFDRLLGPVIDIIKRKTDDYAKIKSLI